MKTKILSLIFCVFVLTSFTLGQTQLSIQFIDGSGNPVTGIAAQIKFKSYPYTGGYLTGITVTEYGTQGNYLATGFTTFQSVKVYVNDVEQQWIGEQLSGDPGSTFVDQSSTESIGGAKTFYGAVTFQGSTSFEDYAIIVYPEISTSSLWYLSGEPTPGSGLVWKDYVENNYIPKTASFDSMFVIRANRIIVDQKLAADLTGKQYNDIKSAVDWVYSNGSPGATNRWTIYIIPSPNYYVTDFTWYDYIDLIGLGEVYITNTPNVPPLSIFTRSGSVGVKAENLNFYSYDASLNIQKIRSHNCNFRVELDNYSPILNIENSQIKNSGFYIIGGASLTVTGANRIINCYGNTSPSWTASDKIYNYSYVIGDDIQY